jgi:hypothetical protein
VAEDSADATVAGTVLVTITVSMSEIIVTTVESIVIGTMQKQLPLDETVLAVIVPSSAFYPGNQLMRPCYGLRELPHRTTPFIHHSSCPNPPSVYLPMLLLIRLSVISY